MSLSTKSEANILLGKLSLISGITFFLLGLMYTNGIKKVDPLGAMFMLTGGIVFCSGIDTIRTNKQNK